jgi:hypothetical protein
VNKVLAASFGVLVLGVALGLLVRFGQLAPLGLPAENATHAHSHALYWGWAGLALFALFFERVRLTGRGSQLVLGTIAVMGFATLGVFTRFGYGKPGVVLSAATVVPFLSGVVMFFHAARGRREADVAFLRAAMGFVVLAYVSAISRVVLKQQLTAEPLWASLAVHLFLGAFGAFFVLGLMGLTVHALGVAPGRLLGVVLGMTVPLITWPSVLPIPGLEHTALGPFARLAAVLMLVPAAAWTVWLFNATAGQGREGFFFRSATVCWTTSVLLLALVSTGALEALVHNRHAVVMAVHLQTLGVVTASLLLLLEKRLPTPSFHALTLHQLGVALMLGALGVMALAPSRPALGFVALGGAVTLAAQVWSAARFLRSLSEGGLPVLEPH